jgi:hypothetical protein
MMTFQFKTLTGQAPSKVGVSLWTAMSRQHKSISLCQNTSDYAIHSLTMMMDKTAAAQEENKFPAFVELHGSSSCLQELVTEPYPDNRILKFWGPIHVLTSFSL